MYMCTNDITLKCNMSVLSKWLDASIVNSLHPALSTDFIGYSAQTMSSGLCQVLGLSFVGLSEFCETFAALKPLSRYCFCFVTCFVGAFAFH